MSATSLSFPPDFLIASMVAALDWSEFSRLMASWEEEDGRRGQHLARERSEEELLALYALDEPDM